jgi:hypothetical protein
VSRAGIGALIVCASIGPLLSGCSLWNHMFHRHNKDAGCAEKPFSLNTDSRPLLKVPDGLSAPDTGNAIKVPDLTVPERARAKSEPCLSRPPNYFSGGVARPSGASAPQTLPVPTPGSAPVTPSAPEPSK